MIDQTIDQFAQTHNACLDGLKWAKKNCPSGMMSEAYDKLRKSQLDVERGYFRWVAFRAHDDKTLRLMACRFIRETPGLWGKLSAAGKQAMEVAESFAHGKATKQELTAAAHYSATAHSPASAAAAAAASDATSYASCDVSALHHSIIASYPNPFQESDPV